MQVHRNIDSLPLIHKAVVTIGTFDGVHTGHQTIIRQLKDEANAIGGQTVLITFDPHPRKVINDKPLQLINTLAEKTELLAQQGVDHLVIVPFTKEFSGQSAEEYINGFLVGRFHPHTVIIGYDHRFGHDRKGDYRLLEDHAAQAQFKLKEIPALVIDSLTVSSTRIREAIKSGDIVAANELLGYEFFFEGEVIPGNRLGRTLGYPTANLGLDESEKLVPGNGIYAVTARLDNEPALLKGMMSIGLRPTIGDNKRMIEVNIFDFNKDIYGRRLRVYVKAYMRSEVKYEGLEALKAQLAKDAIESRRILG